MTPPTKRRGWGPSVRPELVNDCGATGTGGISAFRRGRYRLGYIRSKEVQMLEIVIVLVIALIVFGPMLLKARKNTDD